jgi:hypothetical protein
MPRAASISSHAQAQREAVNATASSFNSHTSLTHRHNETQRFRQPHEAMAA